MNKTIQKLKSVIFTYEFLRFFIISGSAVLIDFLILNFEVYVLHFNPFVFGVFSLANLISASISIVFNFTLQKLWSFKHKGDSVMKLAGKFMVVHAVNIIFFNGIFYGSLYHFIPIPPITKIIVTGFQTFWSFFMYKYFVFKKKDSV